MQILERDHPEVLWHFEKGHHVMQRTEAKWAGLPTDQTIGQTLMRTLMTRGGLTRVTGMDEMQRKLWIHSRPACAAVDVKMQDLCGMTKESSEQHKEQRASLVERDNVDIAKIIDFFGYRNPFENDSKNLRSIITGATAHPRVNVEQARTIGKHIVEDGRCPSLKAFIREVRSSHRSCSQEPETNRRNCDIL